MNIQIVQKASFCTSDIWGSILSRSQCSAKLCTNSQPDLLTGFILPDINTLIYDRIYLNILREIHEIFSLIFGESCHVKFDKSFKKGGCEKILEIIFHLQERLKDLKQFFEIFSKPENVLKKLCVMEKFPKT